MEGKTVIITGATSGIGEETLIALAAQGARVGFVGRSLEKCKEVRDRARLAAGHDGVRYHLADLTRLDDVERVANEIQAEYPVIDVLINNAGLISKQRQTTADGLEMMFGVNHLAHFLLTHRLMPSLTEARRARIINVASAAFMMSSLRFDDLQWEKRPFFSMRAYADSKHANILFTLGLAQRLAGTPVTANCLHPGVVATGFVQGFGPVLRQLSPVLTPFLRSPAQGARTSIYLACSPRVAEVTGTYFVDCKRGWLPAAKRRQTDIDHLWDVSEALLAEHDHPVDTIGTTAH